MTDCTQNIDIRPFVSKFGTTVTFKHLFFFFECRAVILSMPSIHFVRAMRSLSTYDQIAGQQHMWKTYDIQVAFDITNALGVHRLTNIVRYTEGFVIWRFA